MLDTTSQVNHGQDRGVLHNAKGGGQVTDENPLAPIGHNSEGEGEIDPDATAINDMFTRADRHDTQGESCRIKAGDMLIEKRKKLAPGFPKTYEQKSKGGSVQTRSGDQAEGHYWRLWCANNIKRSFDDVCLVMRIAGGNDPEAALKKDQEYKRIAGQKHRAKMKSGSLYENSSEPLNLRKPILEKFADSKPHKVAFAAEKIGTTVERLVGDSRAPLKVMHEHSHGHAEKYITTLSPDGKSFTITKREAAIPLSEIETELKPMVAALMAEGRKSQGAIIPANVLNLAERIQDKLDKWAGRESEIEKRAAKLIKKAS